MRKDTPNAAVSRLYVAEPFPSNTGVLADHRVRLKASEVEPFARAIASAVGVPGVGAVPVPDHLSAYVTAIAEDLKAAGAKALAVAGEQQPAVVHALAHAINVHLGAQGTTVVYTEPAEVRPAEVRLRAAELAQVSEF